MNLNGCAIVVAVLITFILLLGFISAPAQQQHQHLQHQYLQRQRPSTMADSTDPLPSAQVNGQCVLVEFLVELVLGMVGLVYLLIQIQAKQSADKQRYRNREAQLQKELAEARLAQAQTKQTHRDKEAGLQDKLADNQRELDERTQKHLRKDKLITKLQTNLKAAKVETNNAKALVREKDAQLKQHSLKLESTQALLQVLCKQFMWTCGKLTTSKDTITEMQQNEARLTTELAEARAEANQAKADLHRANADKQEMDTQHKVIVEAQIKEIESGKQQLTLQKEEQAVRDKDTKVQMQALTGELAGQQARYQRLTEDCQFKDGLVAALTQQVASLHKELVGKNKGAEILRALLEAMANELANQELKYDRLAEAHQFKGDLAALLTQQATTLHKELGANNKQAANLRVKLSQRDDELAALKQQLAMALSQHNEQTSSLRMELGQRDDEVAALKQQLAMVLSRHNEQTASLRMELGQRGDEVAALKQQLAMVLSRHNETQEIASLLNSKLASLFSSLQSTQ